MLRFHDGDWIEVTDDWRELHGLPGELRRIRWAAASTTRPAPVELASPDRRADATDPQRNTAVRRWDQGGQVRQEDGTGYVDLDDAGSTARY